MAASKSSNIETVLQETRVFPPSPEMVRQANVPGMEAYRKLCAEAVSGISGASLKWDKVLP